MRIEELSPIGNECANATAKKPKQRAINNHVIVNTGRTIRAGMDNYRLTDDMLCNDEDTKILIDQEHIIGQIAKLLINIKGLRKEIDPAFMMTLISEPFNNTLIH